MTRILTALGLSILIASTFPADSMAQTSKKQTKSKTTISKRTNGKTVKIVNKRSMPKVSLDVRNASLHQALTRLFYASKVDFVLEGNIPTGLVTTKIENQPFETALRLILASSDAPLTYQRTGNIYLIRATPIRPVNQIVNVTDNPVPPTYTENGWVNNTAVAPNNNYSPFSVGYEIGPNGVQPTRNTGSLQFGPPLGSPAVLYNNPVGFGYPSSYNNPYGFYGWPYGSMNARFGSSGYYLITP